MFEALLFIPAALAMLLPFLAIAIIFHEDAKESGLLPCRAAGVRNAGQNHIQIKETTEYER